MLLRTQLRQDVPTNQVLLLLCARLASLTPAPLHPRLSSLRGVLCTELCPPKIHVEILALNETLCGDRAFMVVIKVN